MAGLQRSAMNDLSLHILDILQNSISAGASSILLLIEERTTQDELIMVIEDNGRGMNEEQVARLADPFYTSRTTRKVGLGIPLLKQSAVQSGGALEVESQPGRGTKVTALFRHSNIDRPPMGDVANAFMLTVSSNEDIRFVLKYIYDGREYDFDSFEVKEVLDGLPLSEPAVVKMLTEMIDENIKDLKN